jgi:uncharacterized protein (DUF488 family)
VPPSRSAAAAIVYTLGHGTRSSHELVEVLRGAGAGRLVDVRRSPASRRHPRFGRELLEPFLSGRDIAYEWWGEELGGRRSAPKDRISRHSALTNASFRNFADHMDTPEFRGALDALETSAEMGPPVALMCAETLWWRCHRRLISDALSLHGIEVVHLLDAHKRQNHPFHEAARADASGAPVYDVDAVPLA